MSIDVEDWFQVENLRRSIPRDSWYAQELMVEQAMERMLALMDEWDVRATCFVLGWVAERAPRLVGRIAEAGHEIASHGYGHELVRAQERGTFRADVERSKQILEELAGQRVVGYRAPSFSITDWALPILREVGYEYDSSRFPVTFPHGRYGKLAAAGGNGHPLARPGGITEVSLSCLTVGRHALPWAGGGYFRLIPYPVFQLGVRRILRSGRSYVFYIHPWELDPGQPRVRGLRRGERLRHYLNLERTESRWAALLRDFSWVPIRDLIAHEERRATRVGPGRGSRERVAA